MSGPWCTQGIHIKSCALAQIIALRVIGHRLTPGAGIRDNQGDAMLCCVPLGSGPLVRKFSSLQVSPDNQ
jgi:hypothetical protein